MPGKVPKIIRLIRQAKGLNADPDDDSLLDKLIPHVPGIVTFADHNKPLPWSTDYCSVLMFADVSGFTSLCERYSSMQDSGIDKLTKTLNAYLGAIVENITSCEGDVLKFAGDAILSVWRVNSPNEMTVTVDKVIQCCLDIQKDYGEWETDIGVTLTVKMGVSTGPMKVTFLGNNEFRVYVETGQAVSDVNAAESFCLSGFVVLSPDAWSLASQAVYETEMLQDEKHVRVLSRKPSKGLKGAKPHLRTMGYAAVFTSGRRMSIPLSANPSMPLTVTPSLPLSAIPSMPLNQHESVIIEPERPGTSLFTMPKVSKLSKLRSVVKTVTEMKLEEALRLFILPPVLKKIDDFQPLEYLSEMRQVSIVFINLVIDTEDETKLMQKIFEAVYKQTKAMDGCLNKVFLFDKGCTFLVIFGLPGFKHEQDCAHSLMCSYRMKTTMDGIKGVKTASIGVTTGTTFCGVVGHSKRHEYSVIGRKVNMAARLMMNYPGKVTCDDNTFQLSRLPPHNFEVLITKRMKGLRNVGIIREFIEEIDSLNTGINSIPVFSYPLLGCEKEVELFQEQLKQLKDESESVKHIVYVGASGIGKTRLLDHLIICAEQEGLRVMSCAVKMNDSYNSNFLTRHILRMLITSAGFSYQIDMEPKIMEQIYAKGLLNSLSLMPQILGTQMSQSNLFYNPEEISKEKMSNAHDLIYTVAEICISDNTPVVIALDDAQNIDTESWKTILELSQMTNILIIMTVRPWILDEPSCKSASRFFDSSNVYIEDISGLRNKYLIALACQLMDVVRIPEGLERILKEICHGVPYWCEQVLIDMVEKKQLMILEADAGGVIEEQTVCPNPKYIQQIRYRAEKSSNENKHCNDIFMKSTMDVYSGSKDATSHNFLKDLGYVHKQSTHRERNIQRIAVFSPYVNSEDIPVPDIMKNLVIAKIDSMRATEQLIVKCAAVLGETFTRDMIESILPNVNRIKARKSFKVLRKVGVFECANLYNAHYNKFSKSAEFSGMECYCPKDDDAIDNGLCNLMKFTNLYLMETCHNILMESQKKALHASAAEYLEKKADQIRKVIPYYTLGRCPPIHQQNETNRNHSRRRSSNRVEDIAVANADSYIRARGRRKGIQIQDVSVILPTVLQSLKSEMTTQQACECLIPIYKQIHQHRTATKDYMRIIEIMIEEAAALIVMKKTDQAIKILEETEIVITEMLEVEKREEDESIHVLYAKLARLIGKAYSVSGDKEDAHLYALHAAKLLNISEPTGCFATYRIYFFYWIYLKFLRQSNRLRQDATEKTVEQGYCLADLYAFSKENDEELNMSINSLRQMVKVTGRDSNLHQTIQALNVMIEYCNTHNHPKLKGELEKEFLASCLARYEELQIDDLSVMATICVDICHSSIQIGEITRAIDSGTAVIEIGQNMKEIDIDRSVFPWLTLILIFSLQKDRCLEIVEKLKSYNTKNYSGVGETWYHTVNMEIMLCWNISPESFNDTVDYACQLMKKPDAVCGNMLARYSLSMSIALWYCRQSQWSVAQTWFDFWELYEQEETTFMSVYVKARKIEIMLMSLNISKKTKPKHLWILLQQAVIKELSRLSKLVGKAIILKPRYLHLKAYFLTLKNKRFKSKRVLKNALKLAQTQKNSLEFKWIAHHLEQWFTRKRDETAEWFCLTPRPNVPIL